MKCKVCGYDKMTSDVGSCPICNFPVIYLPDDSAENKTMMENLVNDYRKNNLNLIKISLVIYEHKLENDTLKPIRKVLPLATVNQLTEGKISWNKQDFARVEEDLELELEIQRFTLDPKTITCQVKAPNLKELWKVGVELTKDLSIVIVVGNEKVHTKSNPIGLFD